MKQAHKNMQLSFQLQISWRKIMTKLKRTPNRNNTQEREQGRMCDHVCCTRVHVYVHCVCVCALHVSARVHCVCIACVCVHCM